MYRRSHSMWGVWLYFGGFSFGGGGEVRMGMENSPHHSTGLSGSFIQQVFSVYKGLGPDLGMKPFWPLPRGIQDPNKKTCDSTDITRRPPSALLRMPMCPGAGRSLKGPLRFFKRRGMEAQSLMRLVSAQWTGQGRANNQPREPARWVGWGGISRWETKGEGLSCLRLFDLSRLEWLCALARIGFGGEGWEEADFLKALNREKIIYAPYAMANKNNIISKNLSADTETARISQHETKPRKPRKAIMFIKAGDFELYPEKIGESFGDLNPEES